MSEQQLGRKQVSGKAGRQRTSAGPQVLYCALALAAGGDGKQRSGGACGQAEADAVQACGGHPEAAIEAASHLCLSRDGTRRKLWGDVPPPAAHTAAALTRQRAARSAAAPHAQASVHASHLARSAGAACSRALEEVQVCGPYPAAIVEYDDNNKDVARSVGGPLNTTPRKTANRVMWSVFLNYLNKTTGTKSVRSASVRASRPQFAAEGKRCTLHQAATMHTSAARALTSALASTSRSHSCGVARSVRCFSADGSEHVRPDGEPSARPDLSPLRQPACARRCVSRAATSVAALTRRVQARHQRHASRGPRGRNCRSAHLRGPARGAGAHGGGAPSG